MLIIDIQNERTFLIEAKGGTVVEKLEKHLSMGEKFGPTVLTLLWMKVVFTVAFRTNVERKRMGL